MTQTKGQQSDQQKDLEKLKDEIKRLAKLDAIDYELERKNIAKHFEIREAVLDKAVLKEREKFEAIANANILFPNIQPYNNKVDLSELLSEIAETLKKYVSFATDAEPIAIALWIVQTYFIDVLECIPILNVKSAEKRCGKSTLLTVISSLTYRPIYTSNLTGATLFRLVEEYMPTLIIDEADSFMTDNEELRGLINSGHSKQTGFVLRCVGEGHELKRFSTFCCKVIAGIGSRQDTIEDRAINITLMRKLETERKIKLSIYDKNQQNNFELIKSKCLRFAEDNKSSLYKNSYNPIEDLNDRQADNWHSLLCLASLAGNEILKRSRKAAVDLSSEQISTISIGVELLSDIKDIFNNFDKMFSSDLLGALNKIDDAPWANFYHGKPMTGRQLTNRLREYNIRPKQIRVGEVSKKGFEKSQFEDAWSRYTCINDPGKSETSETPKQSASDTSSVKPNKRNASDSHAKQNQNVSDKNSSEAASNLNSFGVSGKSRILEGACPICNYNKPFCDCNQRRSVRMGGM